jgi:hypothetical protein
MLEYHFGGFEQQIDPTLKNPSLAQPHMGETPVNQKFELLTTSKSASSRIL